MSQFNEYLLLQRATPNAWSALKERSTKKCTLPYDSTEVHYKKLRSKRKWERKCKGMYFSCWLSNEL